MLPMSTHHERVAPDLQFFVISPKLARQPHAKLKPHRKRQHKCAAVILEILRPTGCLCPVLSLS
jgi:hypothetical protein